MSVHHTDVVVASFSQFYCSYIPQAEHGTVCFSTDDHVLIVGHVLVASAVFQYISESIFGFGAQSTRRSFEILFSQHSGYV